MLQGHSLTDAVCVYARDKFYMGFCLILEA